MMQPAGQTGYSEGNKKPWFWIILIILIIGFLIGVYFILRASKSSPLDKALEEGLQETMTETGEKLEKMSQCIGITFEIREANSETNSILVERNPGGEDLNKLRVFIGGELAKEIDVKNMTGGEMLSIDLDEIDPGQEIEIRGVLDDGTVCSNLDKKIAE